ncbi:MAG: hypothetical protein LBT33_01675 [Spirochaetia bacterium]|nr:hypothetical protein [Spirochaetia bacterium]
MVARKAGISFNTFQGWINKGIFPRVNEAARIAAALGAPVEFFVSGTIRDNKDAAGTILREVTEVRGRLEVIEKTLREL